MTGNRYTRLELIDAARQAFTTVAIFLIGVGFARGAFGWWNWVGALCCVGVFATRDLYERTARRERARFRALSQAERVDEMIATARTPEARDGWAKYRETLP
jgi:hypothetical protein